MRQFFAIFVALWIAFDAAAGVKRVDPDQPPADAPVSARESAALFVGIREFPYDRTLAEVRYAVDDAVDLAYLVAMDRQPRLVEPKRVVLALSGNPQKRSSQKHLEELRAAGASIQPAREADVLKLLEQQAQEVGPNGILIVAFATHGISDDGSQFLMTADSLLRHRGTGVAEAKVREIVSQARVPRSVILIDACRQRLRADTRAGDADPRSAAAFMAALGRINGHVVISAAAAGKYAYDDDVRRNGVFTASVLDGLRCQAAADERGYVTVDTLSQYVEHQVLSWIRRHRDPKARVATQLYCEGACRRMPLSACVSGTARAAPPPRP